MIAALAACFAVRCFVGASSGAHRWTTDIPVSAIALLVTGGFVMHYHPDILFALIASIGIGAMGATIITDATAGAKRACGSISLSNGRRTEARRADSVSLHRDAAADDP